MKKRDFKDGQFIFKTGETAREVFLLVNGEIGIFLPTNDTKTPSFTLKKNDLFGEMGVIENQPRMAEARCISDCTVLSMDVDEFNNELDSSNIFVRGVLWALSNRLRDLQKQKQLKAD
jgi:CRP/FNR family cyclic AMP-dependent transcriptional regulator